MFRRVIAVAAFFLFVLGVAAARAERRFALVIGNDAYRNLPSDRQLHKAVNDARAMKAALEKLGFEVIADNDAGYFRMVDLLAAFERRLAPGDLAFFFYAGHGVSFGGANYLLPADIEEPQSAGDEEERRIAKLSLSEPDVIAAVQRAKARVAIVTLDACRDNPLASPGGRSFGVERGLAPPPQVSGVLSIYSAGVGEKAQESLNAADRDPNSLFTRVFLRKLTVPNVGLVAAAQATRREVARLAAGIGRTQVPSVYSQILGDGGEDEVYLNGRPAPVRSADAQEAEFERAMSEATVSALDDFLTTHPSGPLANIARRERERLSRQEVAELPVAPPAVVTGRCGGMTLASLGAQSPGSLSASEECALEAKAEFKECETCPTMVVVPAGIFTMGSPKGEEGREDDEGPQHDVQIGRPFAVGKFEVSFEEWDACVADGGCRGYKPSDEGWGRGRMPTINVSWNDAQAYASWLSRKTRKRYRLLSEAEWEYAARGGTRTAFWWGSSISTRQAIYDGNSVYNRGASGPPRERPFIVDSLTPNPFGLYNVHGNVWEWVADCYHESYAGAPRDGSAWTTHDCGPRVLRGGSWGNFPSDLRAAVRRRANSDGRDVLSGLRLARTLTP